MNASRRLFLLGLLPLLAGCASPAQRIHRNQELFDSFPLAAQARIRGGQIDLGFTPDMVRIALGEPARQLRRREPAGDSEIWLYFDIVRRSERQRADIDGLSLAGPGGGRAIGGSAWIQTSQEREYIRVRVEFRNGLVTAFEEPLPADDQP